MLVSHASFPFLREGWGSGMTAWLPRRFSAVVILTLAAVLLTSQSSRVPFLRLFGVGILRIFDCRWEDWLRLCAHCALFFILLTLGMYFLEDVC